MADPVTDPVAEHDARYGEEGAGPPEGARVRDRLARAGVAWFTTTRPEGGPHITPAGLRVARGRAVAVHRPRWWYDHHADPVATSSHLDVGLVRHVRT
jgi:hypothetical protein